jgi:hypothetical protein
MWVRLSAGTAKGTCRTRAPAQTASQGTYWQDRVLFFALAGGSDQLANHDPQGCVHARPTNHGEHLFFRIFWVPYLEKAMNESLPRLVPASLYHDVHIKRDSTDTLQNIALSSRTKGNYHPRHSGSTSVLLVHAFTVLNACSKVLCSRLAA